MKLKFTHDELSALLFEALDKTYGLTGEELMLNIGDGQFVPIEAVATEFEVTLAKKN